MSKETSLVRLVAGVGGERREQRPTWVLGAIAVVGMVALLVGLWSGTAAAATVHPLLFSFGGAQTPAGSFDYIPGGGVAVDNSTSSSAGDVYVMDGLHKVADKFTVSGSGASYDCQITGKGSANPSPPGSECDSADPGVSQGSLSYALGQDAVDASGNLWHADALNHAVDEFSPTGRVLQQLTVPASADPDAVAIDAAGDVFVAACSALACSGAVDEYVAATSSWVTFATVGGATGVAVDNDPSSPAYGDVYVSDRTNKVVDVFSAAGTRLSQLPGTPSGAFTAVSEIAIDQATGDVYVASGFDVSEFDTTGAYVSQIPVPGNFTALSVAIAASGDLYVAAGTSIDVFGAGEIVPNVATGQATAVTTGSATVSGHVDPDGGTDVTACEFEYVDQVGYNASATDPYSAGQTVACSSPAAPYSTATSVAGSLSNLSPSTTYHYRIEASNSNGIVQYGTDQTFSTPGPPTVDSQYASPEPRSATVYAQINPNGLDTSCTTLQYVSDADYKGSGYSDATTVPCSPGDLSAAFGDQSATATISGLSLDTTYHYRFVATNSAAPTGVDGPDGTFSTFGLDSFSFTTTDQNGNPYTQAGGHPYELTSSFTLNGTSTPGDASDPTLSDPGGMLHEVVENLPPGLTGNPTAVPECTPYQLDNKACPADSQVGDALVGTSGDGDAGFPAAIYNVVPPPGVPAEFAFRVNGQANGEITAGVRTGGDYGITVDSLDLTTMLPITAVSVTMWGVPADPSHTNQRCATPTGPTFACSDTPGNPQTDPTPSSAPVKPFLTMPTSCAGSQTASVSIDAYQDPGDFSNASTSLPANTGCGSLDFTPSISVQPDASVADSPSGLDVDLHVPQNQNPSGLAEANLKDATVTLPQGVTVDPSAASGLTGCTPDEIGISNANAPTCPDSSKVGTVEVDTPLLPNPLTGGIYVAQQDKNPFGSLLAIYLTAYADGVWVKLAGHVVADPVTGQLTTTFSNNPQLPFTDFKLNFFGGNQGILATPQQVGTYTTTSDLTPWSGGAAASPSDSFQIASGAVSGFAPTFTAGTQNPQAGSYSPFVLSMSRSDTDQNFQGLSVQLPPGMLANLSQVSECSDAQLAQAASNGGASEQANPSCPANSQVGTVQAGSGVGPDPFFLSGKVYLTGPYKGGPYGLAVVVPAVAGPYDLGTVVVRQALEIDPTTAQATDVSDNFPTILQGIPLDVRRIDVDLNRPDFTLNPTSCDPMQVTGTATSTGGLSANLSSAFQVGGCQELGFSPKLKIALSGKGKTRSGDHPTLTATLTDPAGQANIRSARVTLPLSLALDDSQNHPHPVCNYYVAQAVHGGAVGCPANTVVGSASVTTPLLSGPLTGPVYFVQGIRFQNGQAIHTLPSLLIPLRGQIALDLRAQSATNGAGALVTTFSTIPDAPVSKFTLQINGGPNGILVITGRGRTICGKAQVATARFGAQSGKTEGENPRLATPACKGFHKRAKKRKKKPGRRGAADTVGRRLA